jgi:hypothetical protein
MGVIDTGIMMLLYRDFSVTTVALFFAFLLVSAGIWAMIRRQVGVDQTQFLKGMIEHHSMVVLMSDRLLESRYPLDQEVQDLARDISRTQRQEMAQMTRWLNSWKKK